MSTQNEKDPAPSEHTSEDRRRFLQTGALAGAAAFVGAASDSASAQQSTGEAAQGSTTPLMTAEAEATPPAEVQVIAADERCGSDFMVDVLKSLDFEYVCANPGSSFKWVTQLSASRRRA